MMDQFKNYLKINVNANRSIETYYLHLVYFFRKFEIFNQENVNDFLSERIEHIAKSHFNQTLSAFRHYNNFCKANIELPKFKKIEEKVSNEKDFLTLDELEKMLTFFPLLFTDYNKRKLVILFLFYTGMRPQELVNLHRADINLEQKNVILKSTKGHKERYCYFPEKVKNLLMNYFKSEPEILNVFNIHKTYFKYIFKKINTEINFHKYVNPYMIRKSFAHYFISIGGNLLDLMNILGHNSLETTQIYANPPETEIRNRWFELIEGQDKRKKSNADKSNKNIK